ncbi:MAG: 4Fe-4S dicluster domain-containing protein [Chloroflexota bacterium]
MQLGFYFDQTRCTGCGTCIVACKDWYDIPAGPASRIYVTGIEAGKFPDLFVAYLTSFCYHCAHPECVAACPENALVKREEDGIVAVTDAAVCLGRDACGMCRDACPYGIPQFRDEPEAKMVKCDLCLERWAEGKPPICVAACPTRALDAGPLDELKKKYGEAREAEGFVFHGKLIPSIIYRPKKDAADRQPKKITKVP